MPTDMPETNKRMSGVPPIRLSVLRPLTPPHAVFVAVRVAVRVFLPVGLGVLVGVAVAPGLVQVTPLSVLR